MTKFKKLMTIIRSHWLVLVSGLILVALVESPLLAFPFVAGTEYKGINIAHFGTDEHYYLTRAKEVADGFRPGSVVLKEYKQTNPDYYFIVNENLIFLPLKLLGIASRVNVVNVYNWVNAFGVFIVILLMYSWAMRLSKGRKGLSALAAFTAVGGYSLVYNKSLFYTDFNIYGRAMYPYVSSIFFFLFLNLLYRGINETNRRVAIYSGLAFGFLFYVYFYAWTYALALMGALFLVFLIRKDYVRLKLIIIAALIGLLIGAFNVYRIVSFVTSAAGEQFSYFSFLERGHGFVMSKIGVVTLVLLALYGWRKKDNGINFNFILGIILAGWIALNQQIITGRILQFGHYYWFFIVPISIIISIYIVGEILPQSKWTGAMGWFLGAVVLLNTVGGQYRSFPTTLPYKLYEQRYEPIIKALNNSSDRGVVLAANEPNETLVTIYTSHDLMWHNYALLDHKPIERIKDSLLIYAFLDINLRKNFRENMLAMMKDNSLEYWYKEQYKNWEGYWSGYEFYDYNLNKVTDPAIVPIRDKILQDLSSELLNFEKDRMLFTNLLKKYEVTYVIWDKNKNPNWDLSVLPKNHVIVENQGVVLIKLDF